jgi:hypothetical protein
MQFLRRIAVTPEVGYALLARGTQGVSMLAAALCVARGFELEQQGLFFVFLSFGALIQLSDFGLSYATLQTASHLRATGDRVRLASFQLQARHINLALLSVAALLVAGLGSWTYAGGAGSVGAPVWAGPWGAFVVAVVAAQCMQLELALLEGGSSAVRAWRLRFVQELLGGCAFIAALLGGAGLWSLSVYWGTRAATAAAGLWLGRLGGDGPRAAGAADAGSRFQWRLEVWPFQWRVGLSGLSGFFIFQAFNPILLVEQGGAAAARFGMSLAIMNMLLMVSTAWPLSQASSYVGLMAQGDFQVAQRRFLRMLAGSTALAAVLAAAALLLVHGMAQQGLPLAARLADTGTTAALLAAALVHHATACFAVMLRAERREPLLAVSVLGGLFTLFVVWLSARQGSLQHIALANLACTLVGFSIALRLYLRLAARSRPSMQEAVSLPPGRVVR